MMDEKDAETAQKTGAEVPKLIEYEWTESVSPVTAVAEAIAAATNREPTRMPPLFEYVDVDALETLVTTGTEADEPVRVTFSYETHRVSVESDGRITVGLDAVE